MTGETAAGRTEMTRIVRVDKYTIEVDGFRITASESTEKRLRTMTDAQLDRFKKVMGG